MKVQVLEKGAPSQAFRIDIYDGETSTTSTWKSTVNLLELETYYKEALAHAKKRAKETSCPFSVQVVQVLYLQNIFVG